jgi:hypothetical protein
VLPFGVNVTLFARGVSENGVKVWTILLVSVGESVSTGLCGE